jgi:hypothetical protein
LAGDAHHAGRFRVAVWDSPAVPSRGVRVTQSIELLNASPIASPQDDGTGDFARPPALRRDAESLQ